MKNLLFILALLANRLVVGAHTTAQERLPLRLVQTIALPNVEGRIDRLAVDLQTQRLFLAALGNNTLEVIDLSVLAQLDADKYHPAAKIPTAAGARTSLFVPALGRLYLAVPHRGDQAAEVRVYEAQ